MDRVGLYQLHHPDPTVPVEEGVLALADLKAEGKITMIGLSNVSPSLLRRAQSVAEIASVQNEFSIFHDEDPEVLAASGGVRHRLRCLFTIGRLGQSRPAEDIVADPRHRT